MRVLIQIVRIIVGVLFIFSGLVKANDPMGLSYKMQEFFEVWGLHGFNSWTLTLSVLMNAFEIIAGFALLLGWRIKLFIWLLLLLIIAFTFLTGYTYVTGKPKNCGCFGDCLPIPAKTSFIKDIVLLLLIALLLWKRQYIQPLFKDRINIIAMVLVTIFSFGLQWYALKYLPVVDCLPFKKGNNIVEKMKMPTNAIPDSTVITFVYTKDGKDVEFTSANFPADFNKDTYTNMRRYDKVVREGKNNQPPIKGFQLSGETNIDSTQFVLEQPYAILFFVENFTDVNKDWAKGFISVKRDADSKNMNCYVVTAEPQQAQKELAAAGIVGVQVFKCDYKAIQTAARVNPTAYLLQKGVVVEKKGGTSIKKLSTYFSSIIALPKTKTPDIQEPADSIPNNQ
jgi:uncharacterized membrane protein YphA (DoxX/SURF4 family)